MTFGQLIEYEKRNEARETSSTLLLYIKKALYDVKASDLLLSVNIF